MNEINEDNQQGQSEIAPGAIIGGCYILFQCIGQSPRSSVWVCRHKDLDGGPLALRILNPNLVSQETACARFHREVVASYTVNHPNVVRTHEFINDGVHVAYTMEFMEFGNLKALLDTGELLSIQDIILIATQVAAGLTGIHGAGIVHRNLKPGNVFFSDEGEIKIADFGIARADNGPKLTNDGEVLGTVGYTSPEYLTTNTVDERSDIYAVGLLLYEMITGNYPYYSPNPVEALRLRITTDPVSPSEVRPECPLELSAITLKAMERNPDDRYQSAAELHEELNSLGTTAILNAQNRDHRTRKKSFWKSIPEPYVDLGLGHNDENASKISKLKTSILTQQNRRRFLLFTIFSGLFALLGLAVAYVVFQDIEGKNTLTKVEQSIKDVKQEVLKVLTPPAITKVDTPTATITSDPTSTYTVQPGDTLSAIAVSQGVSTKALMKLNNISNPRALRVGATLKIPR